MGDPTTESRAAQASRSDVRIDRLDPETEEGGVDEGGGGGGGGAFEEFEPATQERE